MIYTNAQFAALFPITGQPDPDTPRAGAVARGKAGIVAWPAPAQLRPDLGILLSAHRRELGHLPLVYERAP